MDKMQKKKSKILWHPYGLWGPKLKPKSGTDANVCGVFLSVLIFVRLAYWLVVFWFQSAAI